ncbi:MAG: hypothetical protein GY842_25100 [bacterium]|nr:hypothetical protein [bacterium]
MSTLPDGRTDGSVDSSSIGRPAGKRRRRRLLHGLLALVIFVAGAITGGAVTVGFLKHHVHQILTHPDEAAEHVASRLRSRLDLTDLQFEQVRSILLRRHAELEDIRREVFPRVRSELDAAHGEIAAVLNEQQREQWADHYDYVIRTWFPPPPAEADAN